MRRALVVAVALALTLLCGYARADGAGVVNVNDAGETELTRLPGIGPAKARAIVAQRRLHPFRKIDELVRVKGIGRKTFGRLRPYLTVTSPTTLTEKQKR